MCVAYDFWPIVWPLCHGEAGRYVRSAVHCEILTNIPKYSQNILEYCQFSTKTQLSEKRHVVFQAKKCLRPLVQP